MKLRYAAYAIFLVVAAFAVFVLVTRPRTISATSLAPRTPDVANGRLVFDIGGCASCHATPGQADRLQLGGGLALASPFGIFKVPNVSSDAGTGIGAWTEQQFVSALLRGTGRKGEHLYPSFPYTSYQRMTLTDARDLFAYMKTLPAVAQPSQRHELSFPFNVRLLLGGWKSLFLDGETFRPDSTKSAAHNRGAYLTEALGHCAECHSRRNVLGGIAAASRYAGGATPDGKGWVPNITPHEDGLAGWSRSDLTYFLKSGVTPNGFPVDDEMGKVVANTARLSDTDRAAMAEYLANLPARPGRKPKKE